MLVISFTPRGGARHFHWGGPLEGPVLQQGELSMVCVGLSERNLKNFWGGTGGTRQNFGGTVPPLAHPSSDPVYSHYLPEFFTLTCFSQLIPSAVA